jgi:hypothetical protein
MAKIVIARLNSACSNIATSCEEAKLTRTGTAD